MPYDKSDLGAITEQAEEESRKSGEFLGAKRRFDEFECPSCNAHNPFTDFGKGDEVNCSYCGSAFEVDVDDDGKMKLREP